MRKKINYIQNIKTYTENVNAHEFVVVVVIVCFCNFFVLGVFFSDTKFLEQFFLNNGIHIMAYLSQLCTRIFLRTFCHRVVSLVLTL